MTDKQIVDVTKCIHFDKSDIPNGCTCYWDGECNHYCYFKQLKHKEKEYEELRRYHNKCCKENEEKLEQWLEKYNQVSRDFYNGKYCNKEHCSLLKAKEQECEKLKQWQEGAENLFKAQIDNTDKITNRYKQALNEIEKLISEEVILWDEVDKMTAQISNIIKKAKEK